MKEKDTSEAALRAKAIAEGLNPDTYTRRNLFEATDLDPATQAIVDKWRPKTGPNSKKPTP